jgi:small subunit ribosomal protein S6
MAAPAPLYDLMLLLDTSAPEEQRRKVLADVESAISSAGSVVGTPHDWGQRPLAFEIRHRTDAEYHLLQFHGPASLLESLQRSLRIADGVLRFRIIKLAPGTPGPPDPPRIERADAPSAPPAEAPSAA